MSFRTGQATQRLQAVSLLSLPDDLLLLCLAHLSQHERFQHVSLVCKRLRELCLAPRMLRNIDFSARVPATVLPRLVALRAFLGRHGQHVEQLKIGICDNYYPGIEAEDVFELPEEVTQLIYASLQDCGGAGSRLRELAVSLRGSPHSTDTWAAGLMALQRLRLDTFLHKLHLPAGISRLQSLTEAYLTGSPVEVERLPSSLTRLQLADVGSEQLPAQLSQLSALQTLDIYFSEYTADGMDLLTTLTSLRTLGLQQTYRLSLPSCLSGLTWLERLVVHNDIDFNGVGEELDLALPSLLNLTCLSLSCTNYLHIPPALAGLSCLQRLYFANNPAHDADFSLPQGPWLASIRWLGLPWQVLESAVGALSSAARLEHLYVCMDTGALRTPIPADHPLWALAATHPPLRRLRFEKSCNWDPELMPAGFKQHPSNVSALVALSRTRPQLRIVVRDWGFERELLECDTFPL